MSCKFVYVRFNVILMVLVGEDINHFKSKNCVLITYLFGFMCGAHFSTIHLYFPHYISICIQSRTSESLTLHQGCGTPRGNNVIRTVCFA